MWKWQLICIYIRLSGLRFLAVLGNEFGYLLSGLPGSSKGIDGNSDFKYPDFSVLLPITALPEGG
jgi:hypothetical protein